MMMTWEGKPGGPRDLSSKKKDFQKHTSARTHLYIHIMDTSCFIVEYNMYYHNNEVDIYGLTISY